jgi:hypothetical protein
MLADLLGKTGEHIDELLVGEVALGVHAHGPEERLDLLWRSMIAR